jgi:amino-acid N-acetyltransferase
MVHKLAVAHKLSSTRPRVPVRAGPVFRRAMLIDVLQLAAIVNEFATEKLLLPRTAAELALELDNYVVAVDPGGRVLACAAVDEYSPSIAEIVSVAVDRSEQRRGLGSQVVLAAEQVARQRGFERVFAMSLAEEFFTALGYDVTPLDTFPEKVARYEKLSADGVDIIPKRCFSKTLR